MLNFKQHRLQEQALYEEALYEEMQMLLEKLIVLGGKQYPRFGNIVIMAGGAGSGKGFILDNLVGVEGRVFDVDALKKLATRAPSIIKRIQSELGVDLKDFSKEGALKDPNNVSKLHELIGDYLDLPDRRQKRFFSTVLMAHPERKPNIIFDVTLKDLRKLEKITRQVSAFGYDKQNIHIVWVVNKIEVAIQQNLQRERVVPYEILVNTHRGAASTLGDILNMGARLKRYMDGDIVFAFNQIDVDSTLVKSGRKGASTALPAPKGKPKLRTKGGSYLVSADYFYAKRKGKPPTPVAKLDKQISAKIRNYVPKDIQWG